MGHPMQFSVRDLLLLTMIVALAVGWWVDRSRLTSSHSDAVKKLEDELAKEHASAEMAWHARSHFYDPDAQTSTPNTPKP